ncbi:hypothetical protein CF319_g5866 [Tilletia indica]|nr:hypothetical protein CF319_g5866 [Tilletia indica]
MSLLIIEDLDGRLIYARAGDGEAVFGSDGEFEFADDSSDWWDSDDEDLGTLDAEDIDDEENQGNEADIESDAQALLHVLQNAATSAPSDFSQPGPSSAPVSQVATEAATTAAAAAAAAGPSTSTNIDGSQATTSAAPSRTKSARGLATTSAESSLEPDEGETTDELGYEEMPYPRLLVGSIAPRGSGISRARARANAQAKRNNIINNNHANSSSISINGNRHTPSASAMGMNPPGGSMSTTSASSSSNNSISNTVPSTPKMCPPPSPSIPNGGQPPAMTVDTVPSTPGPSSAAAAAAAAQGTGGAGPPLTPFQRPEMGTFIPSQDKAVHRAIIDGANKAPSPYQRGKDVMTRGLAPKRKHDDSDGRNSRQRIERRAHRGRSPMGMSSARMGGSGGGPSGSGQASGSNSNNDGNSMALSNGPHRSAARNSRRKKARVPDMDPGISLDELLDMELLSEGGLVQR